MDLEKKHYINEQVDIDYIRKAKNSSLAFFAVAVLLLLLNKHESNYKMPIIALCIAIISCSIVRFFNNKNYFANKKNLEKAVVINSTTAIINGFLWCVLGILTIFSYEDNNFQIIVMFIILIAFSAGSIVTLSHKPLVFNIMNYLVLLPQAIYSITQYIYSNDSSKLWLLGYTTINVIYNHRQGKVVKGEINSRFANEYDLKKSLEEVALSKKNLEEESIKTFHASRLSSLGEMAGSVAHEINNPLTIIQGLTKSIIVHDEENISEATLGKLTKINSASERIAKIVKGMKIISSKNDQIEHEVVRVSKVLEISTDLYEEKFKTEGIEFTLENISDPEIVCNPLQISQILINLMSNAIDALQKLEGERKLTVKVTEDLLNHNVDIRMINSGPLLEEAIAAKIFEPFYSTKSLGKGTGLGLSISQTLAHSNHGVLIYESYENQICFRLHLNTRT